MHQSCWPAHMEVERNPLFFLYEKAQPRALPTPIVSSRIGCHGFSTIVHAALGRANTFALRWGQHGEGCVTQQHRPRKSIRVI